MIAPTDIDYIQTKRLKKNGNPLHPPFRELAIWIHEAFGVAALNILLDRIEPHNRPRLTVVLEYVEDVAKFKNGVNFDSIAQSRVKERFLDIVSGLTDEFVNLNGLFVIFVAFEPVARVEANERLSEKDIKQLKARLNNPDVWEISRCFDSVTFFFYTDAQVKQAEALGLRGDYTEAYSRLILPHDEFGYLRRRAISVAFDSKENFDNNYQSNWFYYSR